MYICNCLVIYIYAYIYTYIYIPINNHLKYIKPAHCIYITVKTTFCNTYGEMFF